MLIFTALLPSAPGVEWICYGVQALVGALLIATTLTARDLWPFSHYPMFAEAAAAMRVGYFVPRFLLEDGRTVGLSGLALVLEDTFNQECAAHWPDPTPGRAALEAVANRFWGEAAQLTPELARATAMEVVLRVAHLGQRHGISIAEKSVHRVNLQTAHVP